jgi:DNA-binding winged helix-turn-helix (wHTH) protein
MIKSFGDFRFDVQRRALARQGVPVKLTGQALDVLALLLSRPGELVTRDEIQRVLWPDRAVAFDHSLDVVIARLRTALTDSGRNPRYVETVPRHGYRLVEPVIEEPDAVSVRVAPTWLRRWSVYAAIAILAAMTAIFVARSRYDRFVPHQTTPAAATSGASLPGTAMITR